MTKRARHLLATPNRPVPAAVPALVLALAFAAAPAAAVAADTLLVANKSEATVSLVALPGGEVVATLPTGAGPHEIAVSPDGRTAVVADYGGREPGSTLTVVDVPRARVLRTVDLGEHRRPHGIVFLDETRVAVTVEAAKALLVVDVASGEVVRRVETGQEVSHMVAVGAGGTRAAVANIGSGSVTLVDLAAGEKLADVPTGAGAEGVAMSADGRWVWVTNREADTVTLVDFAARQVVATIPSADFPIRAELTPDGRHLLVTNAESGDLTVIDTAERAVARRVDLALGDSATQGSGADGRLMDFEGSSVPIGVEIAPDGRRAWIAHANADVVQVLDLESWKPVGVIRAGKEPDGMAYSPRDVEPAEAAVP
jgi:YVTN family beta-propeller protein